MAAELFPLDVALRPTFYAIRPTPVGVTPVSRIFEGQTPMHQETVRPAMRCSILTPSYTMIRTWAALIVLWAACPSTQAHGQILETVTEPSAERMHYRFAEGRAATMGGLEIALADSLEDGFRVASRLPTMPSFLWIAPFAARSETDHPYIDTRRTTGLPMMAVLHGRRASAAVVVGWQEHFERHRWASCPMCRGEYDASSLSFRTSSEESQITTVAEALVAVPVHARMSIGMSVSRVRAGGFDVPSSPPAPGLRRRHGDIESIRVSSTIIPLDHHSLDIVLATSRRDLQFITAYSTSYGSPLPSDPAWPVHFENEAVDTYGLALNYRMRLRDRLTGGLRLAIDRHDYDAIADRATLARRT
jgi:hypothetical protein